MICALLSWYEESPAWLAETVASTAKLCDYIIAVDGPYAQFPGALKKAYSGTEQADAIYHTASGLGMGCTIHAPRRPWWDGEVGKRDFMFRLGETFTTPRDWYLRIDADEILTDVPTDAKRILSETPLDVAEAIIWERETDGESPFRCLFRAIPGIRIAGNHYTVVADGQVLNGKHQVPAESAWGIRLEHRTNQRSTSRLRLKKCYSAMIEEIET